MRPNNKHHNTVIVNSAEKPNSKLENFLHMKVRKCFIKERLTSNSLYFFIYQRTNIHTPVIFMNKLSLLQNLDP